MESCTALLVIIPPHWSNPLLPIEGPRASDLLRKCVAKSKNVGVSTGNVHWLSLVSDYDLALPDNIGGKELSSSSFRPWFFVGIPRSDDNSSTQRLAAAAPRKLSTS